MASRRRKNPDKLLADAQEVLGEMVADAQGAEYQEGDSFSQRLVAVAKATDCLAKVVERRWAVYMGRMSPGELAEFLQWREDRKLRERGVVMQ